MRGDRSSCNRALAIRRFKLPLPSQTVSQLAMQRCEQKFPPLAKGSCEKNCLRFKLQARKSLLTSLYKSGGKRRRADLFLASSFHPGPLKKIEKRGIKAGFFGGIKPSVTARKSPRGTLVPQRRKSSVLLPREVGEDRGEGADWLVAALSPAVQLAHEAIVKELGRHGFLCFWYGFRQKIQNTLNSRLGNH